MKGFKHTGRGPKMGHSFGSQHGFTHSGTNKQNVKGYTRGVPGKKPKFATGGMVTAPMASGDSSVIKRTKPVTSFDAEHGGKGPLRPGFKKGGKACYAEGGKVGGLGEAIRMVKTLMAQGNSPTQAAEKAARRYNVPVQSVKNPGAPTGGGGLSAGKQMLARGGLGKSMGNMIQRVANTTANVAIPAAQGQKAPMGGLAQGLAGRAVRGAVQGPPSQVAPAVAPRPMMSNHGYGNFGRRPVVG